MLNFIFALIARLPLGFSQWFGAGLGRLIYVLSASYRRKVDVQLTAAGFSKNIALKNNALEHTGRLVAELPWVWTQTDANLMAHVELTESVATVQAITSGRPTIYLTPHLGSFEVAGRAIASLRGLTVMFKPPKIAALEAIVKTARGNAAMKTVPANFSGVRQLLKSLKRGEAIGLLPDQVPSDGDGVMAKFFDTEAYTMTLQAKLASASNALVVLVVCERLDSADQSGYSFRLHMELMDTAPEPIALNQALEVLIRRYPEQYLWGYNRFKVPQTKSLKIGSSNTEQ